MMETGDTESIERFLRAGSPGPTYVCPDCKSPLHELYCPVCGHAFARVDGVPRLFPADARFEAVPSIAEAYDDLYATRTSVWENQGRTREFIRYFAGLLDQLPGERLLEIGCGEGFLLGALRDRDNFATDLSLEAIRRARTRARANYSLALSECLPYPTDYFDVVTSVGVMEHFLDIDEALREIRRVLKPGAYYVSLTHVRLSLAERIAAKVSEFVFPRPRPRAFARWLRYRLATRLPEQPVQNRYTTEEARTLLARAGFNVRDVIHTRKEPQLPLIGPYVVIYIARK